MKKELVIIGGGPAGLAAAVAAKEAGIDAPLILERDGRLGGILNQCIHNGFGLHTFKEELTGPEYAGRYIGRAEELGIPYMLGTFVIDLAEEAPLRDKSGKAVSGFRRKIITAMSREKGLITIEADAVVLAMGCRERPRGALNIPGYRPAGIYSAGTAQRYVNMEGRMPGREVVILGSGDIGLIMARRMTLEGAKVKLVAELMPYSGGLKRNIVQCLDDYGIPLRLRTTVVDIKGKERVEAVVVAEVDESARPVPGTEEEIVCDTLLLSCGLIPENELTGRLGASVSPATNGPLVDESLETDREGVFACGNVLHVHDLVDYVSEEAALAGRKAAKYIQGKLAKTKRKIPIRGAGGVRYTVPAALDVGRMEETQVIRFRVDSVYQNCMIEVSVGGETVSRRRKKVLAPGEMEQTILKRSDLERAEVPGEICIKVAAVE